jgi:glycosyltransferase involved in cell wall biosynthesis
MLADTGRCSSTGSHSDLQILRENRRPKARLVALSSPGGFSGLCDAVLGELHQYCEVVSVIDGLRVPLLQRLSMALRTMGPARSSWGRRYYAALGRFTKKPSSLRARIKRCERELARLRRSYDLIYQFGALFGALERPTDAPLVLHVDFTTRLAEKYYPAWLPGSVSEIEEWNRIEGEIYRSANLILAPTDLVVSSLSDDYAVNQARIALVRTGAHVGDLAEDFPKPENALLVFAAPDFERHGGAVALRIFEGVRRLRPDVTLTTVTNRCVNGPAIHNLGIVPRSHLHNLLRQAMVLLVPGPVGGYQTVTEGMAAKCLCVVARNNPHMYDLVRNQQTGLRIDPADPAQAGYALAGYLGSPDRIRAIGLSARHYVLQDLKWSRTVEDAWREIEARFGTCRPSPPISPR